MSERPVHAAPGQTPLREALKVCREHFVFSLIFSALVNIAYLAPTLYMLQVYDRVLPSGSHATLTLITVVLVVTLVVLNILDHLRTRILQEASTKIDTLFSGRLFRRAIYAVGQPETRLSQLMREFDTIRAAATGPGIKAAFDAPWIPIYIIICFVVHPAIGMLVLAGAVILFILAGINEATTRAYFGKASAANAAAYAAQEAVGSSADVVRALGMTEAFAAQFELARANANQPQNDAANATGRISAVIRFLRLFLQSAALGAGAWLAIDKQISAGAIFACAMLAGRALSPMDQVVAQWRAISLAVTSYGNLRHALAAPDDRRPTSLPPPEALLTVDRIAITTPMHDRFILRDVSFQAPGGAVLAIIGPSGAGKSTLLQTIAGARLAEQGVLRIGGGAYGDWDSEKLGRLIGYMPQDSVLFPGTIADNISRFDRWNGRDAEAVDRDVIAAATAAGIHELVLKMPQGYDTPIGARGAGLSAGQQQRTCLARAIYGDPVLYVLDEPNSNLDAEGEASLMQVIGRLRERGAIVVIAAHKLSVVAEADTIAVLREGRIERMGPAAEILAALTPRADAQPAGGRA